MVCLADRRATLPDADGPILAGSCEPLAVGAPRDAENSAAIAGDDQLGTGGGASSVGFGARSQIRILSSCPTEASRVPSGLNATSDAQPSCARNA